MRRGHFAFQITGSLLAILCALSFLVAIGGCAATAADRLATMPTAANTGDLLRSQLRAIASLSGVMIPLSRTEEDAIIARAVAEHEIRNP
jgi:hypothetical protein